MIITSIVQWKVWERETIEMGEAKTFIIDFDQVCALWKISDILTNLNCRFYYRKSSLFSRQNGNRKWFSVLRVCVWQANPHVLFTMHRHTHMCLDQKQINTTLMKQWDKSARKCSTDWFTSETEIYNLKRFAFMLLLVVLLF